jgi:hypothetical protein
LYVRISFALKVEWNSIVPTVHMEDTYRYHA